MSAFIRCNGCYRELETRQVVITGNRSDGTVGLHPVPDKDFHLCRDCALLAFKALPVNQETM